MLVTPFGIVILVKPPHPMKVPFPMIVTPSGIVILIKILHP